MNSNPKDLLYTNRFVPEEVLNKNIIDKTANNFKRYQELRVNDINNVNNYLADKVFVKSKETQDKIRAEGWNKGNLGNQRPILSDFTRDVVSDSYFQYEISYVNIDSRQRDLTKYLKPNNYDIYLNNQFENVVLMRLIDYNFPNFLLPINRFNNVLVWFTPPPFFLNSPYSELENVENYFEEYPNCNPNIELISQFCFNKLGKMSQYSFKVWQEHYAQRPELILTCTYKIVIPPGYYSTEELQKIIREEWSKQTYFNSKLFNPGYPTTTCQNTGDHTTCKALESYDEYFNLLYPFTSQLIYVDINPITNRVSFLLRLEEIKIKKMQSYRGKNYIDITLDIDSTSIAEFQVLCNNYTLPLVATDLPDIGGLNSTLYNMVEFIPKCYMYRLPNNPYYEFLENDSCDCDKNTNIIRIFNYNLENQCLLASASQTIDSESDSDLFKKGRIGREQPFCFLTEPTLFTSFYNKPIQQKNYLPTLAENFTNYDGSSKSLLNLLGFHTNTQNNISLSTAYLARGINTNLDSTKTLLDRALYYFYTTIIRADADTYSNPQPNTLVELVYTQPSIPSKLMNIYLGPNGKYYFFSEDYIFLRLKSTQYGGNLGGGLLQAVSNASDSSNAGSTNSVYENYLDYLDGVSFRTIEAISKTYPDEIYKLLYCTEEVTSADGIVKYQEIPPIVSVKDLSDLFCKIRLNNIPLSGNSFNILQSETEFYNTSIGKLDTINIQFLDYEGKLLDLRQDHNFVLMVVEKIEKLKETNINSRTGSVDNIGNNFTFTH